MMSVENQFDRGLQIIEIQMALQRKDNPVYLHSFDIFVKNTGRMPVVDSTLKVELFCSEKDYRDKNPKEVRQWDKKVNISSLAESKVCSIKVTSASLDQFLRIRWTLDATGLLQPIEGEIDLRDEQENATCIVTQEPDIEPFPVFKNY